MKTQKKKMNINNNNIMKTMKIKNINKLMMFL